MHGVMAAPARVTKDVLLPADVGSVWRLLTHAPSYATWFGAEVSFSRLARSEAAEFRFPDGMVRGAVFEEVVPMQRLAFRWLPFAKLAGTSYRLPATRVQISLEPTGEGTRLTVSEAPFMTGAGSFEALRSETA